MFIFHLFLFFNCSLTVDFLLFAYLFEQILTNQTHTTVSCKVFDFFIGNCSNDNFGSWRSICYILVRKVTLEKCLRKIAKTRFNRVEDDGRQTIRRHSTNHLTEKLNMTLTYMSNVMQEVLLGYSACADANSSRV